ncbi:hypothetical protein [Rhodopila sp.]|uniref:hypothetical protein n=1 Tax=Rhodopila sp. TaxID=2480087 RepID=UPI003D0C7D0D
MELQPGKKAAVAIRASRDTKAVAAAERARECMHPAIRHRLGEAAGNNWSLNKTT